MSRIILFKGKRVDNGEWIEGYYVFRPDGKHLIYWQPFDEASQNTYHEVNPETVCQFTGLTDKNGNKIFEGDKINFSCAINGSFVDSVVEYDSIDGAWSINWDKETNRVHYFFNEIEECEIIGNIHD